MKYKVFTIVNALLIILAINSCINEEIEIDDKLKGGTEIPLYIESSTNMVVKSSAAESELKIKDAYLLIFDKNGKYSNGEKIDILKIKGNGTANPILRTFLKFSSDMNIVVLLNTGCDYGTANIPLEKGISGVSDINKYFKSNNWQLDKDKPNFKIPMSGSVVWSDGVKCNIERAISKISVQISQKAISELTKLVNEIGESFTDIRWSYCNCPLDGNITKDGVNSNYRNEFVSSGNQNVKIYNDSISLYDENCLYIVEFNNSTKGILGDIDNKIFSKDRFCIMLQAGNRWYRIDLYDKNIKQYLDVNRNKNYIININQINSLGYTTKEEAYNNPTSSLEYFVTGSPFITDNSFFLVIDGEVLTNRIYNPNFLTELYYDMYIKSNGQYAIALSNDTAAISVHYEKTADRFNNRIGKGFLLGYKFLSSEGIDIFGEDYPNSITTKKIELVGSDKKTIIPTNIVQLYFAEDTIPIHRLKYIDGVYFDDNDQYKEPNVVKAINNTYNSIDNAVYMSYLDSTYSPGAIFLYPKIFYEVTDFNKLSQYNEEMFLKFTYGNIICFVPVGKFYFKVECDQSIIPFSGAKRDVTVTSYALFGKKKVDVPWRRFYTGSSGMMPQEAQSQYYLWMDIDHSWRDIDLDFSKNKHIITVREVDKTNLNLIPPYSKAQEFIMNQKSVGNTDGYTSDLENFYNLSHDTGMPGEVYNTANCYVVNAPGWYAIPLVYGNAIKDGNANENSYKSPHALVNESATGVMFDYLGNDITSPWIYLGYNYRVKPVIIWENVKGLIGERYEDVDKKNDYGVFRIVYDNKSRPWLVFSVSPKHGSALIGIEDSRGRIMWSWHIWVTDYKLGTDLKTITTKSGKDVTLWPDDLGYCEGYTYSIGEVDSYVDFDYIQAGTGAIEAVRLTQEHKVDKMDAYTAGYVWGRKDPQIPAIRYFTKYEKYRRDKSNERLPKHIPAIQKPYLYLDTDAPYQEGGYGDLTGTTNGGWIKPITFRNLWNMNEKGSAPVNYNGKYNLRELDGLLSTPIEKTIYDPCPVGYHVPVGDAFTGFSGGIATIHNITAQNAANYKIASGLPIPNNRKPNENDFVSFYCKDGSSKISFRWKWNGGCTIWYTGCSSKYLKDAISFIISPPWWGAGLYPNNYSNGWAIMPIGHSRSAGEWGNPDGTILNYQAFNIRPQKEE